MAETFTTSQASEVINFTSNGTAGKVTRINLADRAKWLHVHFVSDAGLFVTDQSIADAAAISAEATAPCPADTWCTFSVEGMAHVSLASDGTSTEVKIIQESE